MNVIAVPECDKGGRVAIGADGARYEATVMTTDFLLSRDLSKADYLHTVRVRGEWVTLMTLCVLKMAGV